MLRRSVASFAKLRVPLKRVPFVTRKDHDFAKLFTCPLPPPLPPHTNANRPTLVLGVEKVLLDWSGSKATLRPYLTEFLTEVMQLYEVVFWSSHWRPSDTYGAMHLLESVLKLPHSTVYNPHTKVPFVADEGTQHVPPHFYALTKSETIQSIRKWKNVTLLPVLGRPMSRVVVLDSWHSSFVLSPRNGIGCPCYESPSQQFFDDAVKQGCVTPISEYEGELDTALWKPNPAIKKYGWPQKVSELPDTALLDLLPMLRKVAAAQDVTRELDHWRHADYTECDDFDLYSNRYKDRYEDNYAGEDEEFLELRGNSNLLGDTTVHAYCKERSGEACDMRNATPIAPLVLSEKSTQLLLYAKHKWIGEDLAARYRLSLTDDAAVVVSDGPPMAVSHAAVAAGGDNSPHPDHNVAIRNAAPSAVSTTVGEAAEQPQDESKGRAARKRQRATSPIVKVKNVFIKAVHNLSVSKTR